MRRGRAALGIVTTALVMVLVGALLVFAGQQDAPPAAHRTATASRTATPSPVPTPAPVATLHAPDAVATVLPAGDALSAALEASAAVFASAPVAVVAPADDEAAVLTGASAAVAVGAPMLLTSTAKANRAVRAELARLDPRAVLVVGAAPSTVAPSGATLVPVTAGAGPDELEAATGVRFGPALEADDVPGAVAGLGARPVPALVVPGALPTPDAATPAPPTASAPSTPSPPSTTPASTTPASSASAPSATSPGSAPPGSSTGPSAGSLASSAAAVRLPETRRPTQVDGLVALTGVGADTPAALATLRAARVPLVPVPGGDPRASTASVEAVARAAPTRVVALGAAFGPPERLGTRVATAATGVVAPGGGQLVFPDVPGVPHKRYVALYGTPGSRALGVLGEQDVPATVERAERIARLYRPYTDATVVPAVELIATIASAGAEDDGSYSRRRTVAELRPLVDAAHDAGLAVVLDLQPGRDDFLTQAEEYTELLELPNVGLALDPEWRLEPDQVHLEQIGSVGIAEVNAVGDWLAELTASRHLPQKMFVLHQFSLKMIRDRDQLDTSHDELATVIHVDGQGTQPAKRGTWNTLRAGAPQVHWGWKNFVDEDVPTLTPEQTSQVDPVPDLVTYQ